MNRKNYCRAESGFLMRPRVRVGFGLTSSGSGRVRAEPTRPDSIFGKDYKFTGKKVPKIKSSLVYFGFAYTLKDSP